MRDPRLPARRPSALAAAVVIFAALAFPAPLIVWWRAFGPALPAADTVLTVYYLAQVVILTVFLAGWRLPRAPLAARIGLVAAGVAVTAAAVLVPTLMTYGLFYGASTLICVVLAVQHLGREPLWPPRPRDVPLTLASLPLIFGSLIVVAAIATYVLGAELGGQPTPHASATGWLGTVAHIDTDAEHLIRSVWTGVGEEVGAVLLVTGLAQRNLSWPLVYAVTAAVRVAYHAQFSLAAAGLAILGVGMVWLWLRYGRLLPLIAAHTLWDALGRGHQQLLLTATGVGLLIVIVACVRWVVRRVKTRRLRKQPPPGPHREAMAPRSDRPVRASALAARPACDREG